MDAPDSLWNEPAAKPARPARRWLRAVARAVVGSVLLALMALGALWVWAGADGSLATTLRWIGQSQPLSAKHATGSLRSGGHVDRLTWQQDGLRVDARDVSLAWQPWSLLHGTLRLDRLSAASVQVDDQRAPAAAPAAGPPAALGLPLSVVLDAFSVGELHWAGPVAFAALNISGRYEFNGLRHQLELHGAQLAGGRYSGRAVIPARGPLTLEASLSGALAVAVPGGNTPVPLAFQATASGPLTELLIKAELQMAAPPAADAAKTAQQTHASATARVTPWAAQPLPQADASFRELNLAALWPGAPQTLLTGSASVRPLDDAAAAASPGWLLQLQLANGLPGPWDQQKLPLVQLDTQGEWRNGAAIVRTLKAQTGGGELRASGEWTASKAWNLKATAQHVNPALLHTQLAPVLLDGQATAHSQGATTNFDASVKAAAKSGHANNKVNKAPASSRISARQGTPLGQLSLRDASASGRWNPQQAGGTLVLSALRVRTDDAELTGQLEVQPAAPGGKGTLTLTAPGLAATLQGELRKTSGGGSTSLRVRDAAQALRWLQKLPGLPATLQTASASGNAELTASWQGGWLDPALQARLELPSFDWRAAAPAAATSSSLQTKGASPGVLKIRALQATLSGRLSQAQLSTQGRMEVDQRRYALQGTAEGGRANPVPARNAALSESAWQGLLKQLSVSVEDPAFGAGAWRLETRGAVPLKWTPTRAGGAFESGAGTALLSAPSANASTSAPSPATLSWQPVRWRPGELVTAGKLTGLPMAWIELLGGPQLAGAGLAGNLVFDGEWDARLGDALQLKASLARSSGDIMVVAETTPGTHARVAAGVKQARVSLESLGEAVTLALRWDSERAGSAEGQLKTRLARAPAAAGTSGWHWPADAPLAGQLRAQLPRIGVWSVLAPPGWRLRGSLAANIVIGGARAAPQLTGELQADDLALRSVVDGIEFGNGRLRAKLDGTRMRIDEFTLQGAGNKGVGGLLTAQGEAGWINGQPQVQLSATLERLRASLRTDRQVTVSGQLQASLKGRQAELTGKLVVDRARFILPDEDTPQLGDDVVVRTTRGAAAGQKAPAEASAPGSAAAEKSAQAVKLAVQIDLGRDLRIQGKGLDTRVRGTLALYGDSLREARLTGTVNTAGGQYRAYGQRLDVEQGVLRFTGPIDNPALDILAIRPNLTQRVGVQITGTALLPRVRLYAQPELPDAEKLSWLVIGRPSAAGGAEAALLQQAALALLGSKSGGLSGGLAASLGLDELSYRGASSTAAGGASEGAVTLGKRFSRNFYAAYERSISGALSTLYIFYDLSQRFTVRAQAGQQSAVDLIFTVPYD